MSEDKVYKDGDIVWVKLGNSWWPGEVIGDEQRLPDEVQQLKKRPYCVVKFFKEDAYEYPKTAKHIHPFQCSKKNEFIKKGLALFNAKNAFMEKFPDDVKYAESVTRPTTTLTSEIVMDHSGGLVRQMMARSLVRRSTNYYENNQVGPSGSDMSGNQDHTTLRRDSVTTILNITPNRPSLNSETQTPNSASATSERTLSTSSTASIVTPNVAASSRYRCNLCDFTTMRQNVLIMHRKSHSSSGGSLPSKPVATPVKTSSSLSSSPMREDHSNGTGTEKTIGKASSNKSTPSSSKQLRKQHEEPKTPTTATTISDIVEKSVESNVTTTRSRRKATPTVSPSPRTSSTTLKRTLRTSRTVGGTIESTTPEVSIEPTESKETPVAMSTTTRNNDDEGGVAVSKTQHHIGTVSPTESKNSEQIRQRLLADWSDEEKEDSHDGPTTSRKGKPSNTLQLPATNASSASVKRRSPTIVPMKTLEGAGQTLVVAVSTQSKTNSTQEATTQRITQRIRNIPKKDRLRDFGSSIATVDDQPKTDKSTTDSMSHPCVDPTEHKLTENVATDSESIVSVTEVETPGSCTTSAPNVTLSCFDFQEEEEEPQNDVLKTIANFKKKYFSPDKDKTGQSSSTSGSEPNQINKKVNPVEQRDKELSAEIDNLLEQTTVCATQTLKDDIISFQPALVKGLPIKERGKRIFKSRNRAPIDDEDIQSTADVIAKAVDVPETNISANSEETKEDKNVPEATPSPIAVERKTRGTSKRVRGKPDSKELKASSSPINGNSDKNKSPENVVSESNVESVGETVYVSPCSRRKPYDNRITRQLMEKDETLIPLIRHSPVELYSCDSPMDNGTHVVLGRRSKTRTPNSLTGMREETLNGGGGCGGSRASSRSRNAVPLTPTDETSSLGVSDAGAEFGSPTSSLDEERLLTPVQDEDVGIHQDNKFKPITEGEPNTDLLADNGDVDETISDDEEIESPPHEALSGNEMNEKDLKHGSKRLKSPKKKKNSKDQEKKEVVGKRRKLMETRSPNTNDLPKRLTRGAIHHQDTELVEQTPNVTHESPENKDLKQQSSERRSTPTRVSSRNVVATKKASDLIASTTDSSLHSSEDMKTTESALETHLTVKENESLSSRSVTESPSGKSVSSSDSKKRSPQQRSSKGRRSKTPATESEIQKSETEIVSELVQDSTKDIEWEKEEENPDEVPNKMLSPSASKRENEDQQYIPECPMIDKGKLLLKESNSSEELLPGDSLNVTVEQDIKDESKTSDEQIRALTSTQKSGTTTTDETTEQSSCETLPRSPQSPKKETLQSPSKISSPSLATKLCTSDLENTLQRDQNYSLSTELLCIPEEILPTTNSPSNQDNKYSQVDTQKNQSKIKPRWDSPEKKVLVPASVQGSGKKSEVSLSPDKNSNRSDSSNSSNKTSSPSDSFSSLLSPVKKLTRSDLPKSTEKVKKLQGLSTEPDKADKAITESREPRPNLTSSPGKAPSEIRSITPAVEGSGNGTSTIDTESDHSQLLLSKCSSPTAKQSTLPTPTPTPPAPSQISTFSPLILSPTVEKVRINVDVDNPLSTQIASLLAANGNSIHHQQHQKLNACSPLKRKLSLEDTNVVNAIASSDGDAVVAHVQSLCPQVKITRKERIIVPGGEIESLILPTKKTGKTGSSILNTTGHFDISQMPIVISNEQISASKELSRSISTGSSNSLSVSNLWQTDLLQPPTTTMTTYISANDNQGTLQQHHRIGHDSNTTSNIVSPVTTASSTVSSNRLNITSRSSVSPSPQKSPAASTGGRKQAGNIVTLPSSLSVKQHQHKFAEALSLADSVPALNTKSAKRRSSQTTPASTANMVSANANRRLNSAPALDVRSTPPAKMPKIITTATNPDSVKSSPTKGVGQFDSNSMSKTWSQSNRQEQKQSKKLDAPSSEASIESFMEGSSLQAATTSSPTKGTNIEENQNIPDVEQINSTAKITAVPIQPIPGYAETFLLCMLVDNMYKPINNIPHYLNTDLNQLVPVPPEAYEGMLPELAVDQPPSHDAHETTNETSTLLGKTLGQQQQSIHQGSMSTISQKTTHLLGSHEQGLSTLSSEDTIGEEGDFKLVLQPGESPLTDTAVVVDPDITDSIVENASDNAIVLNLENQQIILDAATFEQLLANPDANTQLVTDDGTEFVLTREVLAALKAQHDGQNVELLAMPSEQQLQDQLIVSGVGITEAGSSSADLLSVALANSEFYGNDVLQIETSLGAGASAAGLQLLASDGSIVFQAPPLPQAHLTPPITAHTSETNAVLNQTPIMSTLEKPSTAVMSGKGGIESPTAAVVSAVQCDMPGMRPNLDDSLAVIGVTTQTSTVPTSLELPITITNPAIAPKVTMAQSGHGGDIVQFQPHRSVATVSASASAAAVAAASTAHIYDDPIEEIN